MLLASKWNRDGTLIASGGQERKLSVWAPIENKKSNKLVKTFLLNSEITDLDWQNSTDLAGSCLDNNICLWNLTQDQPIRVWRGHQTSINMIKWDPAGTLLASCSEDDIALLWSPK
jgi:WD40 repeat protein